MKIYFANSSEQKIGGGWSFMDNIKKVLSFEITEYYPEATHYFISGPTMVQRDEVDMAKKHGKKIVLRLDNAVRNSRNRNTGMSRMKDFAEMADLVVYQSQWAFDYLFPFTLADGVVIHNGIDQSIFNTSNRKPHKDNFLYSRYNRDETKNWEMARYIYQTIQQENPDAKLTIVGNFSRELMQGNFDFFMGENIEYLGVIKNPQRMAEVYKNNGYFIFTYFNDACSNTLIEALCSGCMPWDVYDMAKTGGSAEIMTKFLAEGDEYFTAERMGREYLEAMDAI